MTKRKVNRDSFESRWRRRQRQCGLTELGPAEFLRAGKIVLPLSAGPFLDFKEAQEMPYIFDVYGRASDWPASTRKRLTNYWMLGSDGCGNPICMSARNGAIWMLDHEDHFKTRQFVNSSVALLAECLLAYMGENDPAALLASVHHLDRPAAKKGTFWGEAAVGLAGVGED